MKSASNRHVSVTDDFYPRIGVRRKGRVLLYSLQKAFFFLVYSRTPAYARRDCTVPGAGGREKAP